MIQSDNAASVALANKHWRAHSNMLLRMITALPARWWWKSQSTSTNSTKDGKKISHI